MSNEEHKRLHNSSVAAISQLLVGLPPEVQGTIIAELMGIWLSTHSGPLRWPLLSAQLDSITRFLELHIKTGNTKGFGVDV